tara:strand:+ start:9261 stop:10310 length:1050 start_codon:yes stop_codon:yes gene_type:complete
MRIVAWPARKNADRNPYQKLLYDAVEAESNATVVEFSLRSAFREQAPDILHIHWPDAFLAASQGWKFWPRYAFLRLICLAMRLRGAKLVWTAHNLQRSGQQNGDKMASLFWPWFLRRVDGVIFMTRVSAGDAQTHHPDLVRHPWVVIPHGHYGPVMAAPVQDVLPDPQTPQRALFFGAVTHYKNAHQVLKSFLDLPARTAELKICGEMSGREPDTLLTEGLAALPAERAAEVSFDNRFLPEDELVREIRAADLVVLPYSNVLNSGAAIFALSAGRPILASDNPLFRELQDMVGPEWVTLIPETLDGPTLSKALRAARTLRLSRAQPDLSQLSWDSIGRETAAFYRSLLK